MISFTRRQTLISATGLVASLPVLAKQAHAAAPLAGTQGPGFYRRKVGTAEVTALLDGYLDITHDLWVGIDEASVKSAIASQFIPAGDSIRIGITSYLINTGSRLILVDSGSSDLFGPTAGKFSGMLAAAGHTADQIDDILVTHMHPDHIGALVSGNTATFPNATVHVNEVEIAFWASETNMASAPDFAKPWYQTALAVKSAYDGRLNIFAGEPELMTGVTAQSLPGHTPGQTGYRLNFDGEELLIWGDACGIAAVQFQHPEAGLVFDVDGETGRQTRARLLDMAATDKVLVASAHCPFPSFGHVARSGSAYAWVPDEYQHTV